jgi:hypothetical protein
LSERIGRATDVVVVMLVPRALHGLDSGHDLNVHTQRR